MNQEKLGLLESQFREKEEVLNNLIQEHEEFRQSLATNGAIQTQVSGKMSRMMTVKDSILKNKETAFNESKYFLSKRVSDLERQVVELENQKAMV